MYIQYLGTSSVTSLTEAYYDSRMRVGYVFSRVCLCVYLSVCMCLCVCESACSDYNFRTSSHRNFIFLVWRYILAIFTSSLSSKVIGSRSRSYAKNDYLLMSACYSFVCGYRSLVRSRSHIKVKVTHKYQGQIRVISKERYSYVGGLHLNQMCSCIT